MSTVNQIIELPCIYPVACHTDQVGPGSTFVAIEGTKQNGADYIEKALERGAQKIVLKKSCYTLHVKQLLRKYNAEVLFVHNPRKALAQLSAQALDYPAQALKIIGVTGTKGKSTTVLLIEHILRQAGYKTALTSSIKNCIGPKQFERSLTTPQPDYLHVFLQQCRLAGVEYVIMEVAAQALSLDRVFGIEFEHVIFTNFSAEHAEFYPTFDDYFQAKASILKHIKRNGSVIVNHDDLHLAAFVKQGQANFTLFGNERLNSNNKNLMSFSAVDIGLSKTKFDLITTHRVYNVTSHLTGNHNIYNMVAAATCAQIVGISIYTIVQGLQTFSQVPGRLEQFVLKNGAIAFIDYAHTASSFEAIFSLMRPCTEQLIILFGCGGERDVSKRSIMGAIAAQYGDLIILTTDNPRSEDPYAIIDDIMARIDEQARKKVIIKTDRKQAITYAYRASKQGSVILILGKGVDEYQIIKNETYYFSEAAILRELE